MELLGGARQCAGCHYHDYDGSILKVTRRRGKEILLITCLALYRDCTMMTMMAMVTMVTMVVCRSNSLVDDTAARRALVRQQFSQEQILPQQKTTFTQNFENLPSGGEKSGCSSEKRLPEVKLIFCATWLIFRIVSIFKT